MNEILYKRLCEAVPADRVLINEPMKKHTTFRIGGPADYFVIPVSWEEAELVISICKEFQTPYYIIGNGSNLLVSDQGYRGVIIQLYKEMSQVEVEGNVIRAQAGASLARIAGAALEAGLTGFEFAAGIPGTLGGACVMNAGAYGGEMKDVLVRVTVLDEDDKISFNIPKMLKENLRDTKNRIHRRKIFHGVTACVVALAEILLLLTVMTQLEMFPEKSIGETGLYQFFHPGAGEETETSVETETSAETETEALTLNPRLMAPPDLWGASGHESWIPAS